MDHYSVLGVRRSASKEEIKDAFPKLAMQYHPDKHSHSSKAVRDGATLRFKQLSEAYEVLIDDHKRSNYDLRRTNSHASGFRYAHRSADAYSSAYSNRYASGYGYGRPANARVWHSRLEVALSYLTTRAFLLNAAVSGTLLGGALFIKMGGDSLWKMNNTGKSFEAAMESIEKAKTFKDKM